MRRSGRWWPCLGNWRCCFSTCGGTLRSTTPSTQNESISRKPRSRGVEPITQPNPVAERTWKRRVQRLVQATAMQGLSCLQQARSQDGSASTRRSPTCTEPNTEAHHECEWKQGATTQQRHSNTTSLDSAIRAPATDRHVGLDRRRPSHGSLASPDPCLWSFGAFLLRTLVRRSGRPRGACDKSVDRSTGLFYTVA